MLLQILFFVALVGIAVFLLNVKTIFKKGGQMEKSCAAKHRMMDAKGISCESCGMDPMTCGLDDKEHEQFLGHK
ncbi:MAG TPA: hypothetical protein P5050_11315 [Bacteroidia bacterium]|nr:hypothetical protein [Sphingobacteriales bacterium]HPD66145.1 hypothetical protein [Bacteroidia bacterium]HRS59794.1 hypothetical protein [Bacteroidia bacterium]HRU68512.1 hypothetical protein [Bacteroidia bacterium]